VNNYARRDSSGNHAKDDEHMKFLFDADLRARGIKFSRQHRDRLIKAGKFPKPVKPGGDPNGANAWIETEIDQYQQRCVQARDSERAA
jgi:predicted DNA-binding transcriptional regulator AlpA